MFRSSENLDFAWVRNGVIEGLGAPEVSIQVGCDGVVWRARPAVRENMHPRTRQLAIWEQNEC